MADNNTDAQGSVEGRSLGDLSNILFDQLDRLNDPDLSGEAMQAEIERSKAVSSVAGQVISNANTVIRGWEFQHTVCEGSTSMPHLLKA